MSDELTYTVRLTEEERVALASDCDVRAYQIERRWGAAGKIELRKALARKLRDAEPDRRADE